MRAGDLRCRSSSGDMAALRQKSVRRSAPPVTQAIARRPGTSIRCNSTPSRSIRIGILVERGSPHRPLAIEANAIRRLHGPESATKVQAAIGRDVILGQAFAIHFRHDQPAVVGRDCNAVGKPQAVGDDPRRSSGACGTWSTRPSAIRQDTEAAGCDLFGKPLRTFPDHALVGSFSQIERVRLARCPPCPIATELRVAEQFRDVPGGTQGEQISSEMRSSAEIETGCRRSVSQKRRSTDESDRGSAL